MPMRDEETQIECDCGEIVDEIDVAACSLCGRSGCNYCIEMRMCEECDRLLDLDENT